MSSTSSQIEATTDREDSEIGIILEGNTGSIDVFSESGIGRAQFDLAAGSWPESLIFRFHLSGLEEMHLHHGDETISLSVNSSGDILQSITTVDGSQKAIIENDKQWMPVNLAASNGDASTVPLTGGLIEVDVPIGFLDNSVSSLTLDWIDFYR